MRIPARPTRLGQKAPGSSRSQPVFRRREAASPPPHIGALLPLAGFSSYTSHFRLQPPSLDSAPDRGRLPGTCCFFCLVP